MLFGSLETLLIAALGIRQPPLVRLRWSSGEGASRETHEDAVPAVCFAVAFSAVLGAVAGFAVGWPGVGTLVGAGLGLPLALRCLGWME